MIALADNFSEPKKVQKIDWKTAAERIYYAALCLALVAVIGFGLSSALSTQPGYCGLCHGDHLSSWKRSAHANVACDACHAGGSSFAFARGKVRYAAMLPAALSGLYPRPITATVSNDACLQCHIQIASKTVTKNAIRMSHKETLAANSCADCHSTTAHGSASTAKNYPELDKCLVCHNNVKASADCDKCHVGGAERIKPVGFTSAWRTTHGQNWRTAHGAGNLKTCRACHSEDFCKRCHGIQLPHPDSWLNLHGDEVKSSPAAKEGCFVCHRRSLCDGCHKLQIPHPKDFLKNHSSIVKQQGSTACYKCHSEVSCDRCHSLHRHPGVPSEKLKLLRKETGLDGR